MTAIEMESAVHKVVDSYNRKELSVIDELYDRGFVYHGNGETANLTREDWRQFISEMLKAFPDMHIHVDDIFTAGDKLCYRMTISGTNSGDLMGLPPTNKKISIRTIGVMRFRDGKVVEEWENYDELGMLRQLGVIENSLGPRSRL
ncbi:MAG: ester cyclase [Candidatus Caldarchaeum sp.]